MVEVVERRHLLGPVHPRKQVHDPKHWKEAEIDFADKFPLGFWRP